MKGNAGILGELKLPELSSVTLEVEGLESEVFSEVLAARWPKLTCFELWDQGGAVELEPLLHVLSTLPLTHFGLPFTDWLEALLKSLRVSPVLKRLRVLDLHESVLQGPMLAWLIEHLDDFKHLERLDLTGAVDPHEAESLSRLGAFIVTGAVQEFPEQPSDEEFEAPEDEEAPPAPNADLDIPDEHGD